MSRPARIAAVSGLKGDSPAAIRSAFTNVGHCASSGKNSRANVVLPAPLGPARIRILSFACVAAISAALTTTQSFIESAKR